LPEIVIVNELAGFTLRELRSLYFLLPVATSRAKEALNKDADRLEAAFKSLISCREGCVGLNCSALP
jgi:hypothetical protein